MVDPFRILKRSQQPYFRRPEPSGRIADHTDLIDRGSSPRLVMWMNCQYRHRRVIWLSQWNLLCDPVHLVRLPSSNYYRRVALDPIITLSTERRIETLKFNFDEVIGLPIVAY